MEEKPRELYIDPHIHRIVEFAHYHAALAIANSIINKQLRVKVRADEPRDELPFYQCVIYPEISSAKCCSEYSADEWQMLQNSIEKLYPSQPKAFYIFLVRELTRNMIYFLKAALQGILFPKESVPVSVLQEDFTRNFKFIFKELEQNEAQEYQKFWIRIIDSLMNDPNHSIAVGSGSLRPVGQYALQELQEIRSGILAIR